MRAELGLPSVKGDDEHGGGMTGGFGGSMGGAGGQGGKGKRPINVKFEIPYFTTSGIQVRYLKIIEPKVSRLLPFSAFFFSSYGLLRLFLGCWWSSPFQPRLCNRTSIGCGRLSTSDGLRMGGVVLPHGWHMCVHAVHLFGFFDMRRHGLCRPISIDAFSPLVLVSFFSV